MNISGGNAKEQISGVTDACVGCNVAEKKWKYIMMHMVAKCCTPFLLWLRETTKQPKEQIPRNVLCEVATMLDILGLLTILSSSGRLRQLLQ